MLQINQIQTTSQVAENYGVSKDTIRDHYERHSDELIENIHYFYEINPRFKTKVIRWTLEGVYMLGFFIKSERAKDYRKKVAKFLRLCKEQNEAKFKEAREHNLRLVDEISNLRAVQISQGRHNQNVINGYKSQISQHNALIVKLKSELAKRGVIYDVEVIERYEQKEENLRAMLHNAKTERDFYRKRTQELKQKQNIKDSEIVRLLNKIQYQMDGVYSEIGAVMAYANDNDRFFIERNQILKG
ncbi:MAG: hypothetical protein KH703_00580 [Campylobacter gracilis]|uniref:hypothetical protein n=1 Tax=Campylobacter gracilis TaxID=824 RepID=UPI0026F33BD6|nr:hypothetical protein [Campylobacter gracilis]MBS6151910.1 hypothetical protein [Campylobacter gracilis]